MNAFFRLRQRPRLPSIALACMLVVSWLVSVPPAAGQAQSSAPENKTEAAKEAPPDTKKQAPKDAPAETKTPASKDAAATAPQPPKDVAPPAPAKHESTITVRKGDKVI